MVKVAVTKTTACVHTAFGKVWLPSFEPQSKDASTILCLSVSLRVSSRLSGRMWDVRERGVGKIAQLSELELSDGHSGDWVNRALRLECQGDRCGDAE